MTSFTDGFNRLVMPVFVTSLTSDILVSIIKLKSSIHVMLKQQVLPGPAFGRMTLLAF